MENPKNISRYKYNSPYNIIPATVGAISGYLSSRLLGIENGQEVFALGGMIGGVLITGAVGEAIQKRKEKILKTL